MTAEAVVEAEFSVNYDSTYCVDVLRSTCPVCGHWMRAALFGPGDLQMFTQAAEFGKVVAMHAFHCTTDNFDYSGLGQE